MSPIVLVTYYVFEELEYICVTSTIEVFILVITHYERFNDTSGGTTR
jgi:hypothetical protein